MEWTDKAIILSIAKYSENSGIVSAISANHGRFKGLVRNITSAKNRGIYQQGNLISATWKARLSEHLGYYSGELIKPFAAVCMHDPIELIAISSICALLEKTLPERQPSLEIFEMALQLQDNIINGANWQTDYIIFEINLLRYLGFCLELDSCAATGQTHDLKYVSPKSGCAVSSEAGIPYKNKLLPLPDFLTTENTINIVSLQDIKNGLALSAYFLNKYVFIPNNIIMPRLRIRLQEMI